MPELNSSSSDVTTRNQFDDALRMAEAFMAQADHAREKACRLLAAEIGAVAVAAAVAAIIVILGFPSGILGRVLVLIIGSAAGLVVAGAIHLTARAPLWTSRTVMSRQLSTRGQPTTRGPPVDNRLRPFG